MGTGAQEGTSEGSELTDALEEAILALLSEDSEGFTAMMSLQPRHSLW